MTTDTTIEKIIRAVQERMCSTLTIDPTGQEHECIEARIKSYELNGLVSYIRGLEQNVVNLQLNLMDHQMLLKAGKVPPGEATTFDTTTDFKTCKT